jgi:hypothetical protein
MHKGVIVLIALSAAALAAEREIVSAEKFRELATLPIGTMRYSEYIGVKDGLACTVVHEMSSFSRKWSATTYCTEAAALDPEFLSRLAKSSRTP